VNGSGKRSSLLRYGDNYGRIKFYNAAPDHQHKRNISRSVANLIKLFDQVIYDLNQCSNVLHPGTQHYAIEQRELDTNAGKQLS
jgi:hypothetical protein